MNGKQPGNTPQSMEQARAEIARLQHALDLGGSLYMPERKLAVLAPPLKGGYAGEDFNNRAYLLDRLYAMEESLVQNDAPGALEVLGDTAGHSLDRHLDAALLELKQSLEKTDVDAALQQQALLARFGA